MLRRMDLRDRFAAHFASALVGAFADAGQIARRAYDLAEAMMVERARRVDDEEGSAIVFEARRASVPAPPPFYHAALLDEPEPMLEPDPGYDDDLNPAWLDPPYDPSWDLETRWTSEPRPGLARTQPDAAEDDGLKERAG
jgi:hypothetical protein